MAEYMSSAISFDFINIVPAMPESEVHLLLFLPTDLNLREYSISIEKSPSITIYLIVMSKTRIKISGTKNLFKAIVMEFYLVEWESMFTAVTDAKTLDVIIIQL